MKLAVICLWGGALAASGAPTRGWAPHRLPMVGGVAAERSSTCDERVLRVYGRGRLVLHDHVVERQSHRSRLDDSLSPASCAGHSCGQ